MCMGTINMLGTSIFLFFDPWVQESYYTKFYTLSYQTYSEVKNSVILNHFSYGSISQFYSEKLTIFHIFRV